MRMAIVGRSRVVTELARLFVDGKQVLARDPRDAIDVRHQVHKAQPIAVLLDAEAGLGEWDPLDAVPRMSLVRSGPLVLVVTSFGGEDLDRRAARRGCFDVLTRRPGWEPSLAASLARALAAHRSQQQQRQAFVLRA